MQDNNIPTLAGDTDAKVRKQPARATLEKTRLAELEVAEGKLKDLHPLAVDAIQDAAKASKKLGEVPAWVLSGLNSADGEFLAHAKSWVAENVDCPAWVMIVLDLG